MADEKKGNAMLSGLMAGALAGAALGLLMAPTAVEGTKRSGPHKSSDYVTVIREKLRRNRDSTDKVV